MLFYINKYYAIDKNVTLNLGKLEKDHRDNSAFWKKIIANDTVNI